MLYSRWIDKDALRTLDTPKWSGLDGAPIRMPLLLPFPLLLMLLAPPPGPICWWGGIGVGVWDGVTLGEVLGWWPGSKVPPLLLPLLLLLLLLMMLCGWCCWCCWCWWWCWPIMFGEERPPGELQGEIPWWHPLGRGEWLMWSDIPPGGHRNTRVLWHKHINGILSVTGHVLRHSAWWTQKHKGIMTQTH